MPIYMKYGDIKGDVTAKSHEKWIALESFSWGAGRQIDTPVGAAASRQAHKLSVSEIVVTKPLDPSTIGLLKDIFKGELKTEVQIDFTNAGKGDDVYFSIKTKETGISSYSVSSGGERPHESLSLNFTYIEIKETHVTPDGKTSTPTPINYNLATQVAG